MSAWYLQTRAARWSLIVALGLAATAGNAGNWTDDFTNLSSWTITSGSFAINPAIGHGSFGPGPSVRATGTDSFGNPNMGAMWRSVGPRPYHAGIATAVFYNSCRFLGETVDCDPGTPGYQNGNRFRTFLTVASSDLGASSATFQFGMGYYQPASNGHWYKMVDAPWNMANTPQYNISSIGARAPVGSCAACSPGWEFMQVEFRGDGSYWLSVTSNTVVTETGMRPAAIINAGVGKVRVGFEYGSQNDGSWDGVRWIATGVSPSGTGANFDCGVPTGVAATGMSTTSVRWTANAAADTNQFGFALMNGGTEDMVSSLTARSASASFTKTGLSPNTSYSRAIRAWNGENNGPSSGNVSRYTLQITPSGPTITAVTHNSLTLTTTGPVNLAAGSSGVVFNQDNVDLPKIQALSLDHTGLSPNTAYVFKAKGVNGDDVATAYSGVSGTTTLSAPPEAGSVTPDETTVCSGDDVTWTAVGGFGTGTLAYYKYAWDQNASYSFTGSEPQWSGGTLVLAASAPGDWYLHVQGYNDDDVPNGSFSYSITAEDCVPPEVNAAISRKVHGTEGPFAINVLLSNAVEGRAGGPTEVIVTFDVAIEGAGGLDNTDVSASSGTVSGVAISGAELTITLSGVADASKLALSFPGIVRVGGAAASPSIVCFGVLVGDVNGDGSSNVLDLVAVRNNLNTTAGAGSFRSDVNADGNINVLDLVAVRNNLNQTISGSCP